MSKKTTDLTSDLLFEMAVPEPLPPKKRARPVTVTASTAPAASLPPELEERTPTLTVALTPLRWCKPKLSRSTLVIGPLSWELSITSPPSDVPDVQP